MSYKDYMLGLYRPPLMKNSRETVLCLDKNEPPFSAFDCVDGLITNEDIKSLRVYPDPYELYEKLAYFVGVKMNQLLITQGSEQAIEFVFRMFLDENDEVVYLNPSFAMFDVFAYCNKAKIKYIQFDYKMNISLKNIIDSITETTKLFVLANPNNPTGTAFNLEELEIIAEHTQKMKTIFLLDEAYFHFYNIASINLVSKFDNLIITRTFSKAFGIAGARIGYAISNSNNIGLLRKLKPIDEINQLSNIVAKKALDNAEVILDRNIKQVKKWKNIFKTTQWTSLKYINTEGNFIILKSVQYKRHKEMFLAHNILPKMDFDHIYLKDCFRFSVSNDIVMNQIFNLINEEF